MPLQGFRLPRNMCGKRTGMMTASFSASFAVSRPATSLQATFGFSLTMAASILDIIFFLSGSSPPSASEPFAGCLTFPFFSPFFKACMDSSVKFI